MISSYPSKACGISKYSSKLMKALQDEKITLVPRRIFFNREKTRLFRWINFLLEATKENPDVVHIQYTPTICGPVFPLFLLILNKLRPRIRIVTTAHEKAGVYEKHLSRSAIALFSRYENIVHRASGRIIVLAEDHRNELIRKTGVAEDRIVVIPHGIDNLSEVTQEETEEFRAQHGLGDSTLIVVFGALRPAKGIEYLISAFARVLAISNDLTLVIAGAVPAGSEKYLASLIDLVEELGIGDHVCITGYLDESMIPAMVATSTIMVLPYVRATQSAVLHNEAISYAKPVIVTGVGGIEEIVIENDIGMVVPPRDAEALSQAIDTMLNDEDLRRRFSENAGRLKEEYSWRSIGKMHRQVYETLLAEEVKGSTDA